MFFKADSDGYEDEEVMAEPNGHPNNSKKSNYGAKLFELASMSTGLSGRALRKIPFLAHANYLHHDSVKLADYMEAMKQAITKVFEDKRALTLHGSNGVKGVMFTQKPNTPDHSKNLDEINYKIFTEEINDDMEKLNLLAEEL